MKNKKLLLSMRVIVVTGLTLMTFLPLSGQILFEDFTVKAGLLEPLKGIMGHAAGWGDINNDGFPDLFVGNFADRGNENYDTRGHTGGPEPDRIFLNNQGKMFTEIIGSPISLIRGRCSGCVFTDFDNDGDLDLIVTHNALEYEGPKPPNFFNDPSVCQRSNYIFRNNGNGKFTDVTSKSNLYLFPPAFTTRNAFVLDFDGDGILDVFLQTDQFIVKVPRSSRLMRNTGNFIFEDVSSKTGIPARVTGTGGSVGDINGDTWPDIFISYTDILSNRLFLNNGNGTFREADNSIFTYKSVNGDWPCGASFGDINNDGRIDIVVGQHYHSTGPRKVRLYLNEGNDSNSNPIFRDVTEQTIPGIDDREPDVQIQDFDNDGLMDIWTSAFLEASGKTEPFILRNTGITNGIPKFSAPEGKPAGYWVSAPAGDFDKDGKLDIIGVAWDATNQAFLMKNTTINVGNYLDVRIKTYDAKQNINGIGATVRIYKAGQAEKKEGLLNTAIISVSNGYCSGTEAIAHFGLGKLKIVDVVVTMPCNGPVYKAYSISANQIVTLPVK